MRRAELRRVVAAAGCLAALLAMLLGCSRSALPHPASFPALDGAAAAHLAAVSSGLVAGKPELAASLSAGEVAARDLANGRAAAAEESAGNTTDLATDVISVSSHPLDDGNSDLLGHDRGGRQTVGTP